MRRVTQVRAAQRVLDPPRPQYTAFAGSVHTDPIAIIATGRVPEGCARCSGERSHYVGLGIARDNLVSTACGGPQHLGVPAPVTVAIARLGQATRAARGTGRSLGILIRDSRDLPCGRLTLHGSAVRLLVSGGSDCARIPASGEGSADAGEPARCGWGIHRTHWLPRSARGVDVREVWRRDDFTISDQPNRQSRATGGPRSACG